MPVSNSYDFSITRDEIIQNAFRKIGALGDYETIDTARTNAGIAALNPMIKTFMNQGMQVWCTQDVRVAMSVFSGGPTVTLSTGNTTVVTGDGAGSGMAFQPLKILKAIRRDNSNASLPIDIEMDLLTADSYLMQSSKNASGAPSMLFFKPFRASSQISVWVAPDAYWQTNGQIILRVQRQIMDFDSATDNPDFPSQWFEALIYGLAMRLAPNYGLSLEDRKLLIAEAKDIIKQATDFDQEEGSITFVPATH
jgi:hypothetical protein